MTPRKPRLHEPQDKPVPHRFVVQASGTPDEVYCDTDAAPFGAIYFHIVVGSTVYAVTAYRDGTLRFHDRRNDTITATHVGTAFAGGVEIGKES